MIERFTFDRLRATLLFLAIGAAACVMPAQNDTWWQLRAGHDMWIARQVLLTDTYSHTVAGAFWPNHEWLSQIVLYAAYAAGGLPLVTLLSAAAVTTAWAIVWALTPASPRTKFALTVFVIASASTTWSPRPQVFSLLLLMTTVWLLRNRRYRWLPPLFCLWANLHGAVLLGVLLCGAALVAAGIEHDGPPVGLIVSAVLSVTATLLTPLGWHFWIEVGASLARIRQLGIDEWAPPRATSVALVPFWMAIVALIAGAATRGRALVRDPVARREGHVTLCACALALAPAALTAARNVPPFLMLAVPAIAAVWPQHARVRSLARASAGRQGGDWQPHVSRPRVNCAIAAIAAILAAATVTTAYARPAARLNWTPLPPLSLAALDRCEGNLYNRYDEGGYLIWFAPGHKVFLDGRQDPYPTSLIRAQVHAESTGDAAALLERYAVGCAYVPAESRVSARLTAAGWVPLYRDRRWAVFARDRAALGRAAIGATGGVFE
jgi:hypothetical protein